jgi:hypothetical protein
MHAHKRWHKQKQAFGRGGGCLEKVGWFFEKVGWCCAPHEVQFHCEKPMFSSWCLEKVGWRLEKVGVVS